MVPTLFTSLDVVFDIGHKEGGISKYQYRYGKWFIKVDFVFEIIP